MARVALVTGGTRGIGEAISIGLKKAGYTVVANYGGNDEAAQKFKQATGIRVEKFDVGNYDAVKSAVERNEKEVGPIDIVVNNAGITRDGTLARMNRDMWDAVIDTNLGSCYNLCKLTFDGTFDKWTLLLAPRDAALAKTVREIRLSGAQQAIQRVEIFEADGDRSVLTIGGDAAQ